MEKIDFLVKVKLSERKGFQERYLNKNIWHKAWLICNSTDTLVKEKWPVYKTVHPQPIQLSSGPAPVRRKMLALVTCLLVAAASASENCQMPGNAICHSVDLPDHQFHPCCSGSQCLPWTGEGYVPNADGPDYFCQYVEDIPVGGDCTVSYLLCIQGLSFILQKRRGSCDASTTCTDGVCV